MRVFGIDCGTECTGYGVVEVVEDKHQSRLVKIACGGIVLPGKDKLPDRLAHIFSELTSLLALHQPDAVAVEEVFYSVNAKSALKLGHVRGVALLAAATSGLPVAEYAPLTIKSSVVGYGLAKKEQVQFMVARLLELTQIPEPADAADALAIAICHIHTSQTLLAQSHHPAIQPVVVVSDVVESDQTQPADILTTFSGPTNWRAAARTS
jgi:crossover junction endodeoxyribonuclease RuvC